MTRGSKGSATPLYVVIDNPKEENMATETVGIHGGSSVAVLSDLQRIVDE